MKFIILPFNGLTNTQLHDLYALRCEVFVVEQKCPYQDVDAKDLSAVHILKYDGERLAAYARILPPGISYDEPSIGRVVVRQKFRKKGYAKDLMKCCLGECAQLFPGKDVVISAQVYLEKFYRDLGFRSEGEVYPEDDIPHIKMRYTSADSALS